MEVLAVRALYAYSPAAESTGRLAFEAGDVIRLLEQSESGWWDGICDGKRGWFPGNFCTPPEEMRVMPEEEYGWAKTKAEDGQVIYRNHLTGEYVLQQDLELPPLPSSSPFPRSSSSSNNTTNNTANPLTRTPTTRRPAEPLTLRILPPHWGCRQALDGRWYYFHTVTNETTWDLDSIDPVTGQLTRRPVSHLSQYSQPSSAALSDDRASATTSPVNTFQDYSWEQLKTDIEGKSWESLRQAVNNSIAHLKYSTQQNLKSNYLTLVSEVVRAVYRIFLASDTLSKSSLVFKTNKMLKVHHRHIMKSLAKLVISAKQASGVWPPPDAVTKMCSEANEVLLAVRHFSRVTEECGIMLPAGSEMQTDGDKQESFSPLRSLQRTQDYLDAIDGFQKSIEKTVQRIQTLALSQDPSHHSELILLTKQVVTDVGQFLSFVDEIPVTHFPKPELLQKLVDCKQDLYNNISGLVAAATASVDKLAPLEAKETVTENADIVQRAARKLVLAAKFVLAEQDAAEEMRLEDNLESIETSTRRSSDLSIRPRRALSLSVSKQASPIRDKLAKSKITTPPPPSSSVELSEDVTYDGPGSAFRRSSDTAQHRQRKESILDGMNTYSTSLPSNHGRFPIRTSSAGKITKFFGSSAAELDLALQKEQKPEIGEWFLGHDYDPQEVQLTMEQTVKGATLRALVERLTVHDTFDPKFLHAFLLTYRTFTTTREMLDLLLSRFSLSMPEGLSMVDEQIWVEKKLKPIRLRVVNVLKSWLDSYAFDEGRETYERIRQFAMTTLAMEMPAAGIRIKKLVERKLVNELATSKQPNVYRSLEDAPPPIIPRNLSSFGFKDVDPMEWARQLTILESGLFYSIQANEFLNKAWSDKEGNGAPNIRAMIQMANQITGWVAETILVEADTKKRCSIMKHFINIAERCRVLHNYNTLMAILAGLNSSPIHRLKRTKEMLSTRGKTTFEELKKTMDPGQNFGNYRNCLRSVNGSPCVPFLGFYLTDLTFLEDGNPNFLKTHPHLINFQKRMKVAEKIAEIQQYQSSTYALMLVPEIQDYLHANLNIARSPGGVSGGTESSSGASRDAETLYQMSLFVEPREREDQKMARLLYESGFS